MEPFIRATPDARAPVKPDIILTGRIPGSAEDERHVFVVDVSIVTDAEGGLEASQQQKKQKYGLHPTRRGIAARASPQVEDYARKWAGLPHAQVKVMGIIWNWRGIIDPESALFISEVLKLRKGFLPLASRVCLEFGQFIYRAWNSST